MTDDFLKFLAPDLVRLKHHAGKHDQSTHGWRFGLGSSAPRDSAARQEWERRRVGRGDHMQILMSEIKRRNPDFSDADADCYAGVMDLSRERFTHYAEKLGFPQKKVDQMADDYFKMSREAERLRAVRIWEENKKNSYTGGVEFNEQVTERLTRKVGKNAGEAVARAKEITGLDVVDDSGGEFAHRAASALANTYQNNPTFRRVVDALRERGLAKRVTINPQDPAHPGRAGNADEIKKQVNLFDFMNGGTSANPTVIVHEFGHMAERLLYPGGIPSIFGSGRTASLYGTTNAFEDFAEWFTAIAVGNNPGKLRAWSPEKYDAIFQKLEAL